MRLKTILDQLGVSIALGEWSSYAERYKTAATFRDDIKSYTQEIMVQHPVLRQFANGKTGRFCESMYYYEDFDGKEKLVMQCSPEFQAQLFKLIGREYPLLSKADSTKIVIGSISSYKLLITKIEEDIKRLEQTTQLSPTNHGNNFFPSGVHLMPQSMVDLKQQINSRLDRAGLLCTVIQINKAAPSRINNEYYQYEIDFNSNDAGRLFAQLVTTQPCYNMTQNPSKCYIKNEEHIQSYLRLLETMERPPAYSPFA